MIWQLKRYRISWVYGAEMSYVHVIIHNLRVTFLNVEKQLFVHSWLVQTSSQWLFECNFTSIISVTKSFVLGHLSNPKKHTIISHMIIITIVIYFHFSHYLQKQRFLSTTQRSIRLNKLISYSFFCFNNIVFISRYNAHPNTKNDKCIIFLSCHLHISWNHTQTTHLIVYFFLFDGLNG